MREFGRYSGLNSRFGVVADALGNRDLVSLTPGRHDILGDALYVIAAPQVATQPTAALEAHRSYIDVHLVLSGTDSIGWAPTRSLASEEQPFDVEHDVVFFGDPCPSVHLVGPEHLAVFFPEDAHAPLLGDGHLVHKCVFKVLVDDLS